jgi:tetratricopeptide (TPR) repeat protein
MDIQVNANKGFLIQKVTFYENNAAWDAHNNSVAVLHTLEVEKFHDCGHGIFFPKQVTYHLMGATERPASEGGFFDFVGFTATRISVNSSLPDDAFAFRFPKNLVVQQTPAGNHPERFLVWGADNKPAKEFDNAEEFNKYVENDALEDLGRKVEKNCNSTKPSDLIDRGVFLLQTKKFDAAIVAFSQVILQNPKSEEANCALFYRGMIYLCCKQDNANAIADLTKCLRDAPKNENASLCHYLRGLAYANGEDALEKAAADMTEAIQLDPKMQDCVQGAYLIRGILEARKGNLTEALADATRAIDNGRENADAFAVRAYILEKMGESKKAIADRDASIQFRKRPSGVNEIDAMFADALHRCLLRLLPKTAFGATL